MPDTTTIEAPDTEEDPIDEVVAEALALDVGEQPNERIASLHRYLRQRGRIGSEIERVKQNTSRLLRTLSRRLDALDAFYGPIAADAVRTMTAGKKTKSVTTPFGVAGFRTVPPGVEVVDSEKLPEAFRRHKWEANRDALARHLKETGEIPEGCALRPAEERFYAR